MKGKCLILMTIALFLTLPKGFSQTAATEDLGKAKLLKQKAESDDKEFAATYSDLKERRLRMENDLKEAENNDAEKDEIKSLSEQVKTLKKQERIALQKHKDATKYLMEMTELISMSPQKRHAKIVDLEKRNATKDPALSTNEYEKGEQPIAMTNTDTHIAKENEEKERIQSPSKIVASSVKKNKALNSKTQTSEKKGSPKVLNTKPKVIETPKDSFLVNNAKVAEKTVNKKIIAEAKSNKGKLATPPKAGAPKAEKKQTAQTKTKETPKKSANLIAESKLKKYDPKEDVLLNPPLGACPISFEGRDPVSGKKRKELAPLPFFAHTEDFMKPALRDKDYITCEAQGVLVEGVGRFINLYFTILSKDAPRSFGFLDKGAAISIGLLNGRVVKFLNAKTDVGTIDINNNSTIYRATLGISPIEYKALMESEVDRVKVVWSTGFEDYEVFETDLLIRILSTLKSDKI